MQVKVFEAEDMTTALKKVKATLGPDAIILSSRTVRKNGMGLLGRPHVEVTAAKESPEVGTALIGGKNPYQKDAASSEAVPQREERPPRPVIEPMEAELQELKQELNLQHDSTSREVGALRDEITQLKTLIEQQGASTKAVSAPRLQEPRATLQSASEKSQDDPLKTRLTSLGFAEDVCDTLAHYSARLDSDLPLDDQLMGLLSSLIQPAGEFVDVAEGPRKIALVGPTGVGKTTTVAKLAARAVKSGLRVALVTIDTYRIAAVEQLRVYGDIMNLPVEVVLTPDELEMAFARHRDKDLIFVDTAGRSPKDSASIDELLAFATTDPELETSLVLAANTRDRELEQVVQRFGRLPLKSLIFTKLDECETLGVLINVSARTELPMAYLTDGQRVPEDLCRVESTEVAARILRLSEDN